jgi:hypothetical protein
VSPHIDFLPSSGSSATFSRIGTYTTAASAYQGNPLGFWQNGTLQAWFDGYQCLVIGATVGGGNQYRLKCNGPSYFGGPINVIKASISGLSTIGASGTATVGTLQCNGNGVFTGNLSAGGTKPFCIAHPTKPGYRLRHRCLEMPRAVNAYRYTLACAMGKNTFNLPDYFEALNTEACVIASPADCFGQAFGSCSTDGSNILTLFCSCAGTFNVLVMADRNDLAAQTEWADFGVERPDPNCEP